MMSFTDRALATRAILFALFPSYDLGERTGIGGEFPQQLVEGDDADQSRARRFPQLADCHEDASDLLGHDPA